MVTKIFKMIEQWTVVTDTRLWIMVQVSKWLPWEFKNVFVASELVVYENGLS